MSKKDEQKKNKKEFSKVLLIQESILVWVVTIFCLLLTAACIYFDYTGELPWVAAICGFPWTAYGVSQACYYRKSEKENIKGGIKYDTVMAQLKAEAEEVTEDSQMPEEEFAPEDEEI